ncbi:uncharacterized protein LOC143029866 [Oratosquilla oratoria]|uniref:uncharacterized protein LOC143029866 n=1 Tax=Oratosquilla oratoria TaxID=337810 RepID=UPI003F761688
MPQRLEDFIRHPIPKVSSPQSLNDLRPVAITPIPSLICEDFVFNWAYSNTRNKIEPQQFGNIKTSSTIHCLIDLLDLIHRKLDKCNTSLALTLIDFRKAFDLVENTNIIRKSIEIGLQPKAVGFPE